MKRIYQIVAGETSPCELIVTLGDANKRKASYVLTRGTHTECRRVLDELKNVASYGAEFIPPVT